MTGVVFISLWIFRIGNSFLVTAGTLRNGLEGIGVLQPACFGITRACVESIGVYDCLILTVFKIHLITKSIFCIKRIGR